VSRHLDVTVRSLVARRALQEALRAHLPPRRGPPPTALVVDPVVRAVVRRWRAARVAMALMRRLDRPAAKARRNPGGVA